MKLSYSPESLFIPAALYNIILTEFADAPFDWNDASHRRITIYEDQEALDRSLSSTDRGSDLVVVTWSHCYYPLHALPKSAISLQWPEHRTLIEQYLFNPDTRLIDVWERVMTSDIKLQGVTTGIAEQLFSWFSTCNDSLLDTLQTKRLSLTQQQIQVKWMSSGDMDIFVQGWPVAIARVSEAALTIGTTAIKSIRIGGLDLSNNVDRESFVEQRAWIDITSPNNMLNVMRYFLESLQWSNHIPRAAPSSYSTQTENTANVIPALGKKIIFPEGQYQQADISIFESVDGELVSLPFTWNADLDFAKIESVSTSIESLSYATVDGHVLVIINPPAVS